MRRPVLPTDRAVAAAVLAAGLCAALALPAGAADLPDPTVTTSGSVTTFEVLSRTTKDMFIPKGGQPTKEFPDTMPMEGDAFEFEEDLLQSGTKVGTDSGKCTVGAGADPQATCDVTMVFAKGTMTFKGTLTFDDEKPFTVPIASGTGAYAGARGEVRVTHLNETDDKNVLAFTTSTDGAAPQVAVTPKGGAGTGGGRPVGSEAAGSVWLVTLGGAAMLAGAGVLAANRRSRTG